MEQTVVIALDASDQANHAFEWYFAHLHRPGNKLIFVHCIELPELKSNHGIRPLQMSPGVLAGMWREEEAKTKSLDDDLQAKLKEKGAAGVMKVVTGKPGEAICKLAEEEQATMIIAGSRGLGKIRRTILGSVSDYLVHHAMCPVVVCRHPSSFKQHGHRLSSSRSRQSSGDSRSRHSSGASRDDSVTSEHDPFDS